MTSAEKYVATQIRRNLSPLRYPGGKRSFAPFIGKILQKNGLEGVRYLEPYAGGGGAALELLRIEAVSSISINDKDPAVYWFWRSAIDHGDEFVRLVQSVELSVREWKKQREILRSRQEGFELGFAAFYLNRTCMSGVIKRCGGPIGGYDQSGKYKIDCRFHRESLAAKIRFLSENRERIHVSQLDAIDFLKKNESPKSDSFFYLDPPYYHKAAELYLNAYEHSDHEKLRDFLFDQFHDHYWLLSYDHCPEVLELYRHNHHGSFHTHHALANKGRKQEFITMSDRTKRPS